MTERITLPVLPLRELVLFPGVTTPIGAGRPGTVRAIEAAMATPDKLILTLCQRENTEQVNSEGLYTIGTIARELSVHHSVVRRVLSENGVQRELYFVRPSLIDSYVPFVKQT